MSDELPPCCYRYHRHLKVARRKEAFKALEKLKSEDPEAYKERAEEIERARIEVGIYK